MTQVVYIVIRPHFITLKYLLCVFERRGRWFQFTRWLHGKRAFGIWLSVLGWLRVDFCVVSLKRCSWYWLSVSRHRLLNTHMLSSVVGMSPSHSGTLAHISSVRHACIIPQVYIVSLNSTIAHILKSMYMFNCWGSNNRSRSYWDRSSMFCLEVV